MEDWQIKLYAPWLPQKTAAVPFVPAFETVADISVYTGTNILSNSKMYVTAATAQKLMEKFGALRIEAREDPTNVGGGHVAIGGDAADVGKPAKQRVLIFGAWTPLKSGNGVVVGYSQRPFEINAGFLAACYERTPEADHPETVGSEGWPPRPITYLSAAEQDAWAMLRVAAGV